MAYNISKFKVKRLENFSIPFEEFLKFFNTNYFAPLESCSEQFVKDNVLTINVMNDFIIGIIRDGILTISSVNIRGDFSGVFYDHVFKKMVPKTRGTLEAVTIWESGDHIRRTTIIAGAIKEEPIEL